MSKDRYFDDLMVPTNPNYDFSRPPEQQAEYVNPVTLNNYDVRWANEAIRLAQQMVTANKKVAQAKIALQEAKDELDDFEQDLLRQFPAPTGATKSLKLLDAYLKRVAFEADKAAPYQELVNKIRQRSRELQLAEVAVDNCKHVWQTLKMAGDHAMTHLAFVKSEVTAARKGL